MISVAICTHNRAGSLVRTIEGILAQDGLGKVPHELLVVDNDSTDDTALRVATLARSTGNLRYCRESARGVAHARNRAVAEAQGDVVAFADDDVLVGARWLSSIAAAFEETGADVVGGPIRLVFDRDVPPWLGPEFRSRLGETTLGPERRSVGPGEAHFLYGANLHFRKRVFEACGAFDVGLGRKPGGLLIGEETDMVQRAVRAGLAVVFDPAVTVGHVVQPDCLKWGYFERYARDVGRTREYRERDRGALIQALRICKSTSRAVLAACVVGWTDLRRADPYQLRLARWHWREEQAHLAEQWTRFFDGGRRRPRAAQRHGTSAAVSRRAREVD